MGKDSQTGLYQLGDVRPNLPADGSHWVAPQAVVIGDVHLGAKSSVWFGAVLRGDNEPIILGEGSNIQENSVLHTDMGFPLTIGANVTIGHSAILHGCIIGDNCLIGMGATLLNGARLAPNCLVGAGALITENKIFEEGSLIVGAPAKAVRKLTDAEIAGITQSAQSYQENAQRFRRDLGKLPG